MAHLGACAECSQELQKLNAELPLPEFPPDSKRGFQKMVEKNKRKHKLINVVCFLTGAAVILAGTVYFLRNAMVVKWDSGIFDVKCVHHYQYQNCRYAYAHDEKQDDALFIPPALALCRLDNMSSGLGRDCFRQTESRGRILCCGRSCILDLVDGALLRAGLPSCVHVAVWRLPPCSRKMASFDGAMHLCPCGIWY